MAHAKDVKGKKNMWPSRRRRRRAVTSATGVYTGGFGNGIEVAEIKIDSKVKKSIGSRSVQVVTSKAI